VPFSEKHGIAFPGKSVNPRLEVKTVAPESSLSGNPIRILEAFVPSSYAGIIAWPLKN
jgi:hypothetical protein